MRSRQLQGLVGETGVYTELMRLGKTMNFKVIHNMPVQTMNGFQQIDLLLFAPQGFFVIEVKNWECEVYCHPRDKLWLTKYPYRDIKVKSPYQQNLRHIKHFSELLTANLQSIIVFPDEAKLVEPFAGVIYRSQLQTYIERLPVIYSDAYVETIYNRTVALKQKSEASLLAYVIAHNANWGL